MGKYPVPRRDVQDKTEGYGPVSSRQMTPEEFEKYFGEKEKPKPKNYNNGTDEKKPLDLTYTKQVEPGLTKEYVQSQFAKRRTMAQIEQQLGMKKNTLYAHMKKWGIRSPNGRGFQKDQEQQLQPNQEEGNGMTRGVRTEISLTKNEYLNRRAEGETRKSIFQSMGIGQKRFVDMLEVWGIRQLDAEEKAVELMSAPVDPPQKSAKEPESPADDLKEMPNERLETKESEEVTPKEVQDNQWAIITEKDQIAQGLHERNLVLQRDVEHLKNSLAKAKEDMEIHLVEYNEMNEALKGAAVIADQAKSEVHHFREERNAYRDMVGHLEGLVEKLENELKNTPKGVVLDTTDDSQEGYITIHIPIINITGTDPIAQRLKLQEEMNEFVTEIEIQQIDRERAASELFDVIQAYVGMIRSDLADLMPGVDVVGHLKKFINHHNNKHEEKIMRYAAERGWKVG